MLAQDACLLGDAHITTGPRSEVCFEHYRTIAEAVDIPQILYNVPARTAVDLANDTVVRLAELDNIVGLKDATGEIGRARELVQRCSEDFAIYSGDDPTARELMLLGGKGSISVTANVAPLQVAQMCQSALAGDEDAAAVADKKLVDLNEVLFLESNPVPVKWALFERGLIEDGIRLPLTVLDDQYHARVREALAAAGVL
jgi:4-hydroxy-tetrahydrodipicolinate synthase